MEIDWPRSLGDQLGFQWDGVLRPRLDTLTDESLHWEPVAGMWGIRRRAESRSPMPHGRTTPSWRPARTEKSSSFPDRGWTWPKPSIGRRGALRGGAAAWPRR